MLLALLLLGGPGAFAQPTAAAGPVWSGQALADALVELRSRGLKIVFSSGVVLREMTVEVEPESTRPREILDQILAPHGLEAQEGPGGSIVVVRGRPDTGLRFSIEGVVRSHRDRTPVEGVGIAVVGSAVEVTTGTDGRFRIPLTEPGEVTLEVRRRGFVVERLERVEIVPDLPTQVAILLDPTPVMEEELVVTPSRVSLLRQEPAAPLALSREDLLALPHLGGDFFRALSLLPGISSNDVSAQFHVRGGRRDETRVVLDGQELYETYHLKDFDNALSVVAPSTLDSVDLSTGGFPVEHGDRMSGVLDMTTRTPAGPARTRLAVSILNASAGSSGSFHDRRGSWIAEARRGAADFAGRLLGSERPSYWDGFGKLDYQLGPRNSLRGNVLVADDELEFSEVTAESRKRTETDYESSYLWLTHLIVVGDRLFVESAASTSRIERDRLGVESDEDVRFEIRDQRDLEVLGLRQQWNLQIEPDHYLKAGYELRAFQTHYDYRGTREFTTPIADIRDDPDGRSTLFQARFEESHNSVYLADRIRPAQPLTLELGLRFDRHSQTEESLLSPRLNLAWAAGSSTVLRAAWGRFTQSQRPYELQVEDGETRFNAVERSEHRVLGVEHRFGPQTSIPDWALRIEVYRREVSNPLTRYENLYEPINTFPEVEPDRVRVAPDRSLAEGFEIFLRGRTGRRAGWWVNYAWSTTEDEIAGETFPRRFDQTHAVNLDLDYRLGPSWTINLAWRYHTGWPTTPISVQTVADDQGSVEFVPVLDRRFSDRLPAYHRLDLRASRRWQLRSGKLLFFVDAQNVYDRANIGGFDYEIDETGALIANAEAWAGFLPSAGITFEF